MRSDCRPRCDRGLAIIAPLGPLAVPLGDGGACAWRPSTNHETSPMKSLALLVAVLGTAPLVAQVRPQTHVSTPGLNIPAGGQWDIAAAKELLPAGPGGIVHTSRCVVAGYLENDGSGAIRLAMRRSTDGGQNWGAAQNLYTLAAGESLDGSLLRVGVSGYSAFVMIVSGVINARTSAHNVLVWGSSDQGQTWSGPLQMNDGTGTATAQYDVDEATMTVSNGICHCAWEIDYDVPTNEDVMYSSCSMSGGVLVRLVPEVRVSNGDAIGASDVDSVEVAADGSVVALTWRSTIGAASASDNDVYVRVSTAAGFDFGTVTETNLTNFPAITSVEKPYVAVAGSNVYVAWADNSANLPGVDDDVRMAVSNDAGGTWNVATVYRAILAGSDADDPSMVASGNRIAIAWHDDRNQMSGVLNISNDVFVRVDDTAGAGILAGTTPEHQVNTLSPPTIPGSASGATLFDMEMVGDTIGVAIEDSWGNITARFGEDAVLCMSCDGGNNWSSIFISSIGSPFNAPGTEGDIDDPRLAMTTNRDCAFIYASEPLLGGSGPNDVTLSGIKLPYLVDNTATAGGVSLECADSSLIGHPVALLISATPPPPAVPLPLDPHYGIVLDFTLDFISQIGMQVPQVFVSQIDPTGRAPLPFVPNLTTLAGFPIYYAGISFDLVSLRWTMTTDPGGF